jgi:hypothetical protein
MVLLRPRRAPGGVAGRGGRRSGAEFHRRVVEPLAAVLADQRRAERVPQARYSKGDLSI